MLWLSTWDHFVIFWSDSISDIVHFPDIYLAPFIGPCYLRFSDYHSHRLPFLYSQVLISSPNT